MQPNQIERHSMLLAELKWFISLRWVAALIVIIGPLAPAFLVESYRPPLRMLVVGGAIAAYNLVFWIVLGARDRYAPDRRALLAFAWLQLILDLVCLSLLTAWTGGTGSPLLGLFVLHMVFASLLLPPPTSYGIAAVAVASVNAALRVTDQWPSSRADLLLLLGWTLMLVLTAFIANHISVTLHLRERALRRQSSRTQAILDTAVDGIITIDERGVILSSNRAAERIFGYSADEMVGRNVSMLMPEPDHSQHDGYIANYLSTGEARIIGIGREVTGRRNDGTSFPVELAVSEVAAGKRRMFTGMVRDITERKRAEAELTALNDELRRQQEALVQHEKMAAMGQLAAGVAHEIANPLASMDSVLQLAMRQAGKIEQPTAELLREQVGRISRIVHQLTEFAHPLGSDWQTVDLNGVVTDAIEMLRFDHRLRRIDVELSLAPEPVPVRVVPESMQQVIVNLVINAVDAVEGVESPRLVVATRREGDWRVLEVEDNGHGIAPEHLSRIFEPFFTTKEVGRGTGLGLSISYNLVKRHGGDCRVDSTRDRGTRMSVLLPPPETHSRGQDDPGKAIPETGNGPG